MTSRHDLSCRLVTALTESHLTVSTAESCTGGLIAKRITDVSGCSSVFLGGFVTYTNEVKTNLLGVDPQIFQQHTEVSEACAVAMAKGVRQRLGTDVGVSTTGYAGPGGGTEANPVGTVYIAVSTQRGTVCKRIQAPPAYDRAKVRELAADTALETVLEAIQP